MFWLLVLQGFLLSVYADNLPQYQPKAKITNGFPAGEKQFPFQVGIEFEKEENKTDYCGGSIISAYFVLTAAHCTTNVLYIRVYMGNINFRQAIAHHLPLGHIINHPEYKSDTDVNDISLIKTAEITFSDYIEAVQLPEISSFYSSYVGEEAITAGWGCTSDANEGNMSPNLMYAEVVVMSNKDCDKFYPPILDEYLCVSTANGISPSPGDSGGPLILKSSINNHHIQIGVMSFGAEESREKGHPVVYTRLTSYISWIKETTKPT